MKIQAKSQSRYDAAVASVKLGGRFAGSILGAAAGYIVQTLGGGEAKERVAAVGLESGPNGRGQG